jgi:hypothetical protein
MGHDACGTVGFRLDALPRKTLHCDCGYAALGRPETEECHVGPTHRHAGDHADGMQRHLG